MADAMVEGGFKDFWQLVNGCKANTKNQASCIDGVSDDAEIADLWASKFKSLLLRILMHTDNWLKPYQASKFLQKS